MRLSNKNMIIDIKYCFYKESYQIKTARIKSGTTIKAFLHEILKIDEEIKVGVYGKLKENSYVLRNNDRIELYESIIADPKIKRKKRALDEKC